MIDRTGRDSRRASALLLALWAPLLAADESEDETGFHGGDFNSAEECRECHPRQYLEWRGSTHAYALVDPVFRSCYRFAVEDTGGAIGTFCMECHSPIGARSGELDVGFDPDALSAPVREGITCDVCHRSEPPGPGSGRVNADFELTPRNVQFGNLHEPARNSFHRSAKSPFLRESRSCGTCHDVVHNARTIERSFSEWQDSVFSGPDRIVECQDCHMLRYSGKAATNGPFREELRRHDFPGIALPFAPFPNRGRMREEIARFLRRSVRMSVEAPAAAEAGGVLPLTVSVKNSGAGHNLPAASMRQMWLEITVRDAEGCLLYRSGHLDRQGDLMDHHSELEPGGDPDLVQFSDAHVDSSGREVPHWRATDLREGSLRPLETRRASYRIPVPASLLGTDLEFRVRLLIRSLGPYALRREGRADLARELPVWEMESFDSGPLPVVREVPRRTEYRVPRDFADLHEAIGALRDGDTVRVEPGEYVLERPLDFRGKSIRVVSRYGPDRTTLRLRRHGADGAGAGSVVVFRAGEGAGAGIEGFTITGGTGTLVGGRRRGGGVYVERSSPVIAGNRIVCNEAVGGDGGGIFSAEGDATITRNEIFACRADRGGGLAVRAASEGTVLLRRNSIQGNVAREGGGLWISADASVRIERCVVAGNEAGRQGGGAFLPGGATIRLDHVTFVYNRAEQHGAVCVSGSLDALATNSIFWRNTPPEATFEIEYSIVDGGTPLGPTNSSRFPLFVDPAPPWLPLPPESPGSGVASRPIGAPRAPPRIGGSYELLPGSPAIDAGDPRAAADPDDTRTDVGALFLEQQLEGFVRGDVNGSARVEWEDTAMLFRHVLAGGDLPCLDAADVDDDGRVNLIDAIHLAWFLGSGACRPAPPFPACGLDPTFGEGLSCDLGPADCADPGGAVNRRGATHSTEATEGE